MARKKGRKRQEKLAQQLDRVHLDPRAARNLPETGEGSAQPQSAKRPDPLAALPVEMLEMIFDAHLDDMKGRSALATFGQTCSKYEALTRSRVHQRIRLSCDARHDLHAPQGFLVRLMPYITRNQVDSLSGLTFNVMEANDAKLAPYKIPMLPFRTLPDELESTACADYVRQVLIGPVVTSWRNFSVVDKCIIQALRNMEKLEIVDTSILPDEMLPAIASMRSLKALRLRAQTIGGDVSGIRNLRHLSFRCTMATFDLYASHNVSQLIQNSASSLQSLEIDACYHDTNYLGNLDRAYFLRGLNSLTLRKLGPNEDFINALFNTIDFMGLKELSIGSIHTFEEAFYVRLADIASDKSRNGHEIRLQNLRIQIHAITRNEEEMQLLVQAMRSFLLSFDSLITLEITAHQRCLSQSQGLPSSLLDAILHHKKLRRLAVYHNPEQYVSGNPWLSPLQVGRIVDGLSHLQDLEFEPAMSYVREASDLEEIGRQLSESNSLQSVKCRLTEAAAGAGYDAMQPIVQGFISGSTKTTESKLQRLTVLCSAWDHAFDNRKNERTDWQNLERVVWDGPSSDKKGHSDEGDDCESYAQKVVRLKVSVDDNNMDWIEKMELKLRQSS